MILVQKSTRSSAKYPHFKSRELRALRFHNVNCYKCHYQYHPCHHRAWNSHVESVMLTSFVNDGNHWLGWHLIDVSYQSTLGASSTFGAIINTPVDTPKLQSRDRPTNGLRYPTNDGLSSNIFKILGRSPALSGQTSQNHVPKRAFFLSPWNYWLGHSHCQFNKPDI